MNLTAGQRLQRAREELGISIEEAAHETRIRVSYLQELEADHPELLHSTAQARGFLRLYADFLNLPYQELLDFWEKKKEEPAPQESRPAKKEPQLGRKWLKRDRVEQSEIEEGDDLRPPQEIQPDEIPLEAHQTVNEPEMPDQPTQSEESPGNDLPEPQILDEESETLESIEEEPLQKERSASKLQNFLTGLGNRITSIIPLKKILGRKAGGDAQMNQPQPEPVQTSDDIFREIGQLMQSRRRMMELNLSDIENFTNLKRAFLVSIEEGRFGELPSTVQGRGMLNNYAKFLGMEESAVMDMYGQALQLQRQERQKPQRKAVKPPVSVKLNIPEKWRKILNPDLVIGGALIVGLFAFIIWGATQVFGAASGEATEAPSISEVLQVTATMVPTEVIETPGTEVEATDIPGVAIVQNTPTTVATVNAAPLQLYIITHDRAYMSVAVDGIETFNGRVSPENVYTYSGNESISLLTGNAAALEVYFNQEYLGNLGDVGEVVDIDFTLAGLITPTPRATGTPTPTLEAVGDEDTNTMEGMMEAE